LTEELLMRGPKPLAITLLDTERQGLESLVRRHGTPQQLARRARMVLAAAAGANNCQIARQLGVSLELVRRWRKRWRVWQPTPLDDLPSAARLTDAPRSGAPRRITAAQACQMVALACESPSASERPMSQWPSREIAAEIQRRGIVNQISGRHAARLLKRGRSNRT
jgi:putative transposase